MKLIPAFDIKKANRDVELFLSITGRPYWEKLIQKTDTSNGLFKEYFLLKRNPFLSPLKQYIQLNREGKSLWKHRTEELDYFIGTVSMINRILKEVNERGQNRIKGRVRSDDIRPLLHEIDLISHFFRNGFDVDFVEYERKDEGQRTYDFLVTKASVEAEIECKWKSIDAGRNIKHDNFCLFCDEIFNQVKNYEMKCLFEIIPKKNLNKNKEYIHDAAARIRMGIEQNKNRITVDDDLEVNIIYLPKDLKITTQEDAELAVLPYRNPNSHISVFASNQKLFIFKVESQAKDKVLETIYAELKKSLDQFSGERPGLIACSIGGIYPEEWNELKDDSGLSSMTSKLFRKDEAKHIHTISYISEPDIVVLGSVRSFRNPTLYYINENSKFNNGEDIFHFKK